MAIVSKFDDILQPLFVVEGGYKAEATDYADFNSRGELVGTNAGITPETFENLSGKVPSAQDMKNLTEKQILEIYNIKFIQPNRLKLFQSPAIAAIMLGAIVHRPALGTFFLGEALNKLGEALSTRKGDNFDRKKRSTLDPKWIMQMNFHIRRVGEGQCYNAIWDALYDYYKAEKTEGQITNRLRKPGAYERIPEACSLPSNMGFMGVTTGAGDAGESVCPTDPLRSPVSARLSAAVQGWWYDLTSIQYAKEQPEVKKDFAKAVAILVAILITIFLLFRAAAYFRTKKTI